jgi:hypothetical protein
MLDSPDERMRHILQCPASDVGGEFSSKAEQGRDTIRIAAGKGTGWLR